VTTYLYRCPNHGEVVIDHPMSAVNQSHICPTCGAEVRRVLVPLHHRWPSNYRPGMEHTPHRLLLDPEFQARMKDKNARDKEEHVARTAHEDGN